MHSNDVALLQQLRQKEAQLQRMQTALQHYAGLKTDLDSKLAYSQSAYNTVISSSFWRLTAPLRAALDALKKLRSPSPRPSVACPQSACNAEAAYCAFVSSVRLDVLASPADASLAHTLRDLLLSLDIQSDVVPYAAYSLSAAPCIALDPPASAALPPVYVLCHTSGTVDVSLSQSAFAILESSESDLALYESDPSLCRKVYYLPCADSSELQFYFLRFMLANDMLSFDAFYERTKHSISFTGNKLCLSMPESTKRRAAFKAEDPLGFAFFPGVRHRVGWLGCAMSYKYMAKLALERGINELLICEDDVLFPPDFVSRFTAVQTYLSSHPGWDVFSGLMADLSGEVAVTHFEEYASQRFLWLGNFISMVFNWYGEKVLHLLAAWDEKNISFSDNTIDRYLEHKPLNVVTTTPFLVGHKDSLDSTLWSISNSGYNQMIASSSKKMEKAWQALSK